jgi:hypothetical protein
MADGSEQADLLREKDATERPSIYGASTMSMKYLALLGVIAFLPDVVNADTCKSLAAKFAQDPNVLSTSELAALRTCVSDVLRDRLPEHWWPV